MQKLFIIFLVINSFCCKRIAEKEDALFQIEKDGKIGFINHQGKVIIQPQFLSAGEFAEGLAPARISGVYGYIDTGGVFVIPPQFEYATSFSEGLAIVYNNDTPFFIDQKGNKAFPCHYKSVEPFSNGKALVKTATGKSGIIDKYGKLIIDTAFELINPFVEGLAIVYGIRDTSKNYYENYNHGVIDTTGKFIVPFGKYRDITDYKKGFFRVEIPPEKNDTIDHYTGQTGFVDKFGKLILSKDHRNHYWIIGYPNYGLVKMYLYKYWIPEERGTSTSANAYIGFMDMKGRIVINDTTFRNVTDFSNNRAFVQIQGKDAFDRHWRIINTNGKFASNIKFEEMKGNGFINGLALVQVDDKWGVIDTNANFIIQPKFTDVDDIGIVDDLIFFIERNPHPELDYPTLYGIAKTDGTIISKPIMQEFDRLGFKDSLLQCIINGRLTYLNKQGKIVWQRAKNNTKQLANVNIDFMNRGYFYASSKPHKNDLGGFGKSENESRKISSQEKFNIGILSVVVMEGVDTFQTVYNGFKVYLANTTKLPVKFNAADSRLNMKVQAMNKWGEWRDIEYLASSWCGNSYHTLTLEPNHYWQFTTPKYTGDFKTKLRIALSYPNPNDQSEKRRQINELTIYSNEYEGSVNPGQFWRKREYYPANIMDPYRE